MTRVVSQEQLSLQSDSNVGPTATITSRIIISSLGRPDWYVKTKNNPSALKIYCKAVWLRLHVFRGVVFPTVNWVCRRYKTCAGVFLWQINFVRPLTESLLVQVIMPYQQKVDVGAQGPKPLLSWKSDSHRELFVPLLLLPVLFARVSGVVLLLPVNGDNIIKSAETPRTTTTGLVLYMYGDFILPVNEIPLTHHHVTM